jgi:hypothetical protein
MAILANSTAVVAKSLVFIIMFLVVPALMECIKNEWVVAKFRLVTLKLRTPRAQLLGKRPDRQARSAFSAVAPESGPAAPVELSWGASCILALWRISQNVGSRFAGAFLSNDPKDAAR